VEVKVKFLFPVIVLSLITAACGLPGNLGSKSTESAPVKNDTTAQSPSTPAQSGSGATTASDGLFKAEALSPISVVLSWDGLKAEKFLLEASVNGSEFANLAELSGTTFTYENFPAIPDRTMKYRLTAINGGSQDKPLVVEVQTPIQKANPLTATMMIDMTLPDIGSMDFSKLDPATINPNDLSSLGLSPTITAESAEIGPDGGQIAVTSSTGVKYTYKIPAGALDDTLTFTISPIASMEGAPFTGGFVGGVMVQPVGLELNVPATLTIEPVPGTKASAGDVLATFNANPDGSEFYFTGTFSKSDVTALSGGGKLASLVRQEQDGGWELKPWDIPEVKTGPVGMGISTRGAVKKFAESNPPTDKNAQAEQNAAAEAPDLSPLIPPAYTDIINRSQGMSGWDAPLSLMSDIEFLYSKAKDKSFVLDKLDKAINNLIDQLQVNLKLNMGNCVSKDDFQAYYAAKNLKSPKNAFTKMLSAKYQSKYGSATIDDVLKKAANCNLRMNINSTVTLTGPDVNITLKINSVIPLKIHYDNTTGSVYYSGSGPIVYDTNHIVAGECNGDFKIAGKNSIVINKLRPVFLPSSATLDDFSMDGFSTPGSFTTLKQKCPKIILSIPIGKGTDMWGGFYTLTKFENMIVPNWKVTNPPVGGGDLATVDTNKSRKIEEGNVEEKTTFKLQVNK
jgi:hypothetical protein